MLNNIKLHGYFGRDPELAYRNGKNGQYAQVSFSLGVGRDFGDETDWFYCVMYGKRAEVIDKYFSKGSEIIVSGRMESYHPKKNPDSTAWFVKVENFDFAGKSENQKFGFQSRKRAQQGEPVQETFTDLPDSFQEQEEDIPF